MGSSRRRAGGGVSGEGAAVEAGARRRERRDGVDIARKRKSPALAYRPRDEGPRADPRRLTDVHGTGQAHTAHPDRKSGLLNSDPPPWAVASDPRATHEGVERPLHQAVVLARDVLGH